jgi:aerobic-type carbon monoxide dehydrogenase small subunit (CoxS/CutS family)
MSVLESLEQSGEVLSPMVRAALVLLEEQLEERPHALRSGFSSWKCRCGS